MNNLDDVDPQDEPRAYRSKSYPRRMLVITAGSLMHMLIAVALLFGVYSTKGKLEPTGRGRVQPRWSPAARRRTPGLRARRSS